jgi:hypothetical protein
MAGGINIEALFAALPDVIGSEADLDVVLRRIGRVKDWDGAKLSGLRHSVTELRLVVRNADGVIVKAAELPRFPTEAERMAALAEQQLRDLNESMRGPDSTPAWDQALGRAVSPDEPGHPRFAAQRQQDAAILAVVGPRLEALEAEVRGLREQIAALVGTNELAAA